MSSLKKIRKLPKPLVSILVNIVKCLSYTLRLRIIDPCGFLKRTSTEPVVYAFWHNRLIGISLLARRYSREKIAVLISRSRDGEYIASVTEGLGFDTIRGSSSKGGVAAVRQIQGLIQDKRSSIAVTLDGPRGPKYTVQPGAIWVASRARIPIIPISVNTKSHWRLNSWDQTQIPKPFAKTELNIASPIHVSENLSTDELKEYQHLLRGQLLKITNWD